MTLDFNPNPVLDPLPTDFRWPEPDIRPAARPEPEYRWEGPMRGATGSARALRAALVIRFSVKDGLVRGEGYSDRWPYDCANGDRRLTITGTRKGDSIAFDIVFPTSAHFAGEVFAFSGAFTADNSEITGMWTYRCKDCTCGEGSSGSLALTRVEEEA